jgi:DNA-binding NarL/FixJ family response regulator
VCNKISSAISKLGARNRAHAVRIADENGWL